MKQPHLWEMAALIEAYAFGGPNPIALRMEIALSDCQVLKACP